MKRADCTNTMFVPDLAPVLTGRAVGTGVVGALTAMFRTLCTWQRRADMRHRLANMEPHLRADIGLDAAAIDAEIAKPFWQP